MEVNSNMSDKEKEVKTAEEQFATEIKSIQTRMDTVEKNQEKSNEEVLKTSEWKTYADRVDESLQKLDENVKTLKAPPMAEKEIEKKEYDNFDERLRLAGMLNARGTKFSEKEVDEIKLFAGSEEKMMQVNNDVRAGYLQLPPEFIKEVIDQLSHEFSPVRQVARRFTTSSNRIQIPSMQARGVASWTQEAGEISEDET